MALLDSAIYVNYGDGSTTGYFAITKRPQNTAVAAGIVRRQFTAPAAGSERAFVCIVAGTTANVTDATWVLTRGAKTTDGTATWQECTGVHGVNGDLTNCPNWTTVKNTVVTLGQIIQRNNGVSLQICSTGGTAGNGSEPSFSDTAGTTTADNTITWTSLGAVGNFAGGSTPHARVGAATSVTAVSGSTIYVLSASQETQASANTLGAGVNVGPSSNPLKILCVSGSHFPPTAADLTTGAQIATTGASTITINIIAAYWYGITFAAGSANNTASCAIDTASGAAIEHIFDTCSFQLANTSTASGINLGGTSNTTFTYIEFRNTTVKFGSASQAMYALFSNFVWKNTADVLAASSTVPTNLIVFVVNTTGNLNSGLLEGLGLQTLSTNNLFAVGAGAVNHVGTWVVKDCKIASGFNIVKTTGSIPNNSAGVRYDAIRCDSSGTNYKSERHTYQADETTETSITRVNGATNPDGTQQSRKIVTTANSLWFAPHQAEILAIWNTATSSSTITVEGTINSASLPNNDDIWIEVEFLKDAGDTLGGYANSTKSSILAANAAVTSSASSWNGGGSGAGWSPFKLSVSVTPALQGYLFVRVFVAKASTTYYVDPLITITTP